jgi:GntR family transcriptional regulator
LAVSTRPARSKSTAPTPANVSPAAALAATDSRLPLFQRLALLLRDRINRREWASGSAIPSEQELAAAYGMSTGTVRRAIEELVAEDSLERRHGSGTYVRRPHLGGLPIRFFDEPTLAHNNIPESRILSIDAVRPPARAAAALSIKTSEKAIRINRLRVWSEDFVIAEHIYLAEKLFGALLAKAKDEIGTLLYPFYESEFGVVIKEAEDELTFSTADSTTARQLRIKTGDPIVVIERTAKDFNGQAFEWRESFGRADRFRYRVGAR